MTTPEQHPPRRRVLRALRTYVLAVLAATAAFVVVADEPLSVLLSVGVAIMLLVPLAVVAFEPAEVADQATDPRPVLKRAEQVLPEPPVV